MSKHPDPTSTLLSSLSTYVERVDHDSSGTVTIPKFWVAYSGGLDSSVLLRAASELASLQNLKVGAVHINHNLSPNAQYWQEHCVAQCQSLNIECVVKSLKISNSGNGIEAAAREARYQAIARVVSHNDIVLLGQHQNDQIETFFLQLLRGAGPAGLSGMPEFVINKHNTRLLRPFLHFTRAQLHEFAVKQDLSWIEDESNRDNQFDRNFLRNEILPKIRDRWSKADKVINRSVHHIQEQQTLLSEVVEQKLEKLVGDKGQLSITGLLQHSHLWQKQLIKNWLMNQEASQPSEKVLSRILSDCIYARQDSQPKVCWGKWQCRRFAEELYLLPPLEDLSGQCFVLQAGQSVALPDSTGLYKIKIADGAKANISEGSISEDSLSEDSISEDNAPLVIKVPVSSKFTIRFGGFNCRFKPSGERHSKPLNQWFKLWQIPPWERSREPLLFADDKLVAVGEIKTESDDGLLTNQATQNIEIVWLKNN